MRTFYKSMELKIENCDDKRFIDFLVNVIKRQIINSINEAKLYRLNQYINSLPDFKSKYRKEITCMDIIKEGVESLKIFKYGSTYYIGINNTKKLRGLQVKVIDACKLINYGAVGVAGFPIFSQTFAYVEMNIQSLYIEYRGK